MRCEHCDVSLLYIIVLHVQDMKTVVADISRGTEQHKNLSDVTLKDCCDAVTRGVVQGLRMKNSSWDQVPSSPGKHVTYFYVQAKRAIRDSLSNARF